MIDDEQTVVEPDALELGEPDPEQDPDLRLAIGLGVAGLAPPLLALAARLAGLEGINHAQAVLVYGTLIQSFLGGSWWGMALLRTTGRWQAILLLLGIGASLAGFCIHGLAGPDLMRPAADRAGAADRGELPGRSRAGRGRGDRGLVGGAPAWRCRAGSGCSPSSWGC
jgi:hypothetical protein